LLGVCVGFSMTLSEWLTGRCISWTDNNPPWEQQPKRYGTIIAANDDYVVIDEFVYDGDRMRPQMFSMLYMYESGPVFFVDVLEMIEAAKRDVGSLVGK
jgi:hypothetical protein